MKFLKMRSLLLIALAVFGLSLFASSAQAGDRYAAIAFSQTSGRWGTAQGYRDKDEALQAAIEDLGARRPATMWARNAWLALAVGEDRGAYGWGWSTDRQTARETALRNCRKYTDCPRVVVCIHARED